MTRWMALVSLVLASCGGGELDGGASPDPGGGGNVGFGGAQDIGQFRGILDSGGIPGPGTLDANGFFSEHYTELPAPDCGEELCLHAMMSMGTNWVDSRMSTTLQIALNTPRNPSEIERLPLNMVVVLDTSGSMAQDNRIAFAKQGLHKLVDELSPGDRLALVTYNTNVTIHNDLATDADKQLLHDTIDGFFPGGATNIFDGLSAGFGLLNESYDINRQNRVMLVSDGLATAGNTDDNAIIAMAEQSISDGIGLTTIGVGLEFDVDLMRGLAERGAGNFYFLESASAVEEVFAEELDFFVSPLALDISIDVIADGAYTMGDVTGTRLFETSGNTGSMYIPAAFLASRTSDNPGENGRRGGGSTLFLDMVPRSSTDPYHLATVRLTYRLPETGEVFTQMVTVNSPYLSTETPAEAEDTYLSNQTLKHQHAMYELFLGLRRAATEAETDYSCAIATLDKLDTRTRAWNTTFEDVDVIDDLDLIAQFRENLIAAGGLTGSCSISDPNGDPNDTDPAIGGGEGGWGEGDDVAFACTAGGTTRGSLGSLLLLMASILVVRRRRRA